MSGADAAGGWLARARAAADAPPLAPREPLLLAGGDGHTEAAACVVGSVERAVANRMHAAGLPIHLRADGWHIDAPASPALAELAAWLRAAGLAGAWRGELLAVVDGAERPVAAVERGVVRVLGLTTFAVHLVGHAFAGSGVWVQQRALDKATDPGLWDTLMGGQVAAGETIASALERETWEEAGLHLDRLLDLHERARLTIRRPVEEGYMVEHLSVFHARLAEGALPANQDGEVARFACFDQPTLSAALARGDFTLEASLILGDG